MAAEFSGKNPDPVDGWMIPKKLPKEFGPEKVSPAPYRDTRAFHQWYYKEFCAAAKKTLNEEINPVPRTFVSAPMNDILVRTVFRRGARTWRGTEVCRRSGPVAGGAVSLVGGAGGRRSTTISNGA